MPLTLVTGGAGFIGSHIAQQLVSAGERVRILDNFSTGSRETLQMLLDSNSDAIEVLEGDVRDADACKRAVYGVDFVLHHAAMASVPRSIERPDECAAINIGGTVSVLNAARESGTVRRVVLASTCAVYGNSDAPRLDESSPIAPLSPYASSKFAAELFCRNFSQLMGLETVVFRYFNVYGGRQNVNSAYAAVIPKFLDAVQRGESPTILGDGEQTRDFVFVDDIVRANRLACAAGSAIADGSPLNIASGVSVSLNRVVEEIAGVVGRPISARYMAERVGDIRHSGAATALAREKLGFQAAIGLKTGIERIMAASM